MFRECKSSLGEDHVGMVKQGRTSRVMACEPEASQAADRTWYMQIYTAQLQAADHDNVHVDKAMQVFFCVSR